MITTAKLVPNNHQCCICSTKGCAYFDYDLQQGACDPCVRFLILAQNELNKAKISDPSKTYYPTTWGRI